MYIISKYKDYYDNIAGQKGIDKSIIFDRHTEDFAFVTRNKKSSGWGYDDFPTYGHMSQFNVKLENKRFSLYLVGFCGKIHIVADVMSVVVAEISYYKNLKVVHHQLYGLENIKQEICNFYKNPNYFHKNIDSDLENLIRLSKDPKTLELFYKYKTPYFVLYSDRGKERNLIINNVLKDIEFYKIMDPFMAFQEIEMYISGVIGVDKIPYVEVADKYKIISHGFDYKFSFRKDK